MAVARGGEGASWRTYRGVESLRRETLANASFLRLLIHQNIDDLYSIVVFTFDFGLRDSV